MVKKSKPAEEPVQTEVAIAAIAPAIEETAEVVPVELVVEPVAEEELVVVKGGPRQTFDKTAWKPRTSLGKKVKEGLITDIDSDQICIQIRFFHWFHCYFHLRSVGPL